MPPELKFWFRSERDRREPGGETETERDIAEFLATATSSNKTTPQRWSTIPGSRAHGATSRVSPNQISDPTINHHPGYPPSSSSSLPPLPQQQQICRVPVPAPTPQYLVEAPGADIINRNSQATDQSSNPIKPNTYFPLTSGARQHQKNLPKVEQSQALQEEISVEGRTYRFRFPSHEFIAKPHVEVQGDPSGSGEVERPGLSTDVTNPPGSSRSHPVELSADTTLPEEPLTPSGSWSFREDPNRLGKSAVIVSSEVPKTMNTPATGFIPNSEPPWNSHGHNAASPVLTIPFQVQSEINQPLFEHTHPLYSGGNGQNDGGHTTVPAHQETEQQSLSSNNAQRSSQPPWDPSSFGQPGSSPSTHGSDWQNSAFDASRQYPLATATREGYQSPNPRADGGGPFTSSVFSSPPPNQYPDLRETFNSTNGPPITQILRISEMRMSTMSQDSPDISRHRPVPALDTPASVQEQLNYEATNSSQLQDRRAQKAIQPMDQSVIQPPAAEPAPMSAAIQNTQQSGQMNMHSVVQQYPAERTTSITDSRPHIRSGVQPEDNRTIRGEFPATPGRVISPPPRESSLNANADSHSGTLPNIGVSTSTHVPSSRQSQNVLTKPQPSKDTGTGIKNAYKKVSNLFSGSGTPITYSPEVMTKRCLEFMDQYGIPADAGLDPFSTILVYARAKWNHDEAQIQHQAVEINRLADRKQTLSSTLNSTQRELQLVAKHRDELRRDLNRTHSKFENSQKLLVEFQESFDRQVEYNKQLSSRLQGVEEENVRLFKKGERTIQGLHKTIQDLHKTNQELQQQNFMTIIEKDEEIKKIKASLQAQIAELQKRIASYGESGFRFVIDDKFRDKMEVAEQMISKLVSYVTRPSFQHLALDLDPTGFLQRNQHNLGNRIWIKFIFGICWEVLRRGFFSSPLGFGVFGAEGDGFVLLDHIHHVLAVHDSTTNKFEILNDKQTNEVRGFLFEQIWGDVISASTAMSPEYQSSASGNKGLSVYLNRRIDVVADELVSVLGRCSGNNLDSRAPAKVRELVRHIGLLGLEMATQRAHLTLEFRAHGEDIQQGTIFMDETVGEGASGAACVDLLTEPALTRLGNGRNDFTEYKILRPGTFVAMRS